MSAQTSLTIESAIERLLDHDFVIPSIQRDFVWDEAQICRLFDSLLRGYPIGTFLFWELSPEEAEHYRFYEPMRIVDKSAPRRLRRLALPPARRVVAVLDGQQRLTSMLIGLVGAILGRGGKERILHLDLLHDASDADEHRYSLAFMPEAFAARRNAEGGELWVPASLALRLDKSSLFPTLTDLGHSGNATAFNNLQALHEACREAHLITAFELRGMALDEVLDVFIRVNSAGTVLSKADLLLSLIAADFEGRDARDAVNELVDTLNAVPPGFSFSRDTTLKAGLMLIDAELRFVNLSLEHDMARRLDREWDHIARSVVLAARLLASFGLDGRTLVANNALLPIAYYLHRRNLDDAYLTDANEASDRLAVKRWLTRTLLKNGFWASAVDLLLGRLRAVLAAEAANGFPAASLEAASAQLGKPLTLERAEVERIVDEPPSRRAAMLLAVATVHLGRRPRGHKVEPILPSEFIDQEASRGSLSEAEASELRQLGASLAALRLTARASAAARRGSPERWAADLAASVVDRERALADHLLDGASLEPGQLRWTLSSRRQLILDALLDVTRAVDESEPRPPRTLPPAVVTPRPAAERRQATPTRSHRGRVRRAFNRQLWLVPDGPVSYSIHGADHWAEIRGGRIVLRDGKSFDSPSPAALSVNGGTSVNGWAVWKRDGITIAELHDRAEPGLSA